MHLFLELLLFLETVEKPAKLEYNISMSGNEKVKTRIKDYKMPYVTSWERIAKKEGKREGMKAKAKETAKRMLEDGVPIETISKYTGLTEKEIKALMN
jgi:predicted transposase/invertase (TIGR01784 family)